MSNELCHEHSGCITDIQNLKDDCKDMKEGMSIMKTKQESVMARLNVILGSVIVAVLMLLANIVFKS